MKTAWIIYRESDAIKNKHYIEMYFKEGKRLGIIFELLFREKIMIGTNGHRLFLTYDGKKKEKPDFVIHRVIDPLLAKQLECLNILVFNNSEVSEICNDKAKTYQQITSLGISCVPTTFHKNHEIVNMSFTKEQVIKSVDGHGGGQVFSGESSYHEIKNGIANSDFVVQKRIVSDGKDVRVYVIGKEMIAAVCRKVKCESSEFRANYSLGGDVSLYEMKDDEKILIEKIVNHFSFAMVGIDFLVDNSGKWIFNEIEDVVGARMLYQCSDINLVRKYLDFIIEEITKIYNK